MNDPWFTVPKPPPGARLLLALLATILTFVALGLLLSITPQIPAPKTTADFAAWTQAIGSILAVGGAAWIAVFQSVDQRRRDLRLKKEDLADRASRERQAVRDAGKLCQAASARLVGFSALLEKTPEGARYMLMLIEPELRHFERSFGGFVGTSARATTLAVTAQTFMATALTVCDAANVDLNNKFPPAETSSSMAISLKKVADGLAQLADAANRVPA